MKTIYHLLWIQWHEWRGARATAKMNNARDFFDLSELVEKREHHRRQILRHAEVMEEIF